MPNPHISKIDDNLYLGDLGAERGLQIMTSRQQCWGSSWFKEQIPHHWHLCANDTMTVGLIKDFSAICDFIDKHRKNGGVLIHCRAGRSRSATAVIAYLMKSNKWGSEKGYEEVRKLRRIMPNWGFREQLEVWEKVEYNIFMDGKSKEEYREWLRIRKERLDLKDLTGDKPICMQCV